MADIMKDTEDICYGCKESEDTSWDGMCFLCWEELMEHLGEQT